jgi:hypothetical protein
MYYLVINFRLISEISNKICTENKINTLQQTFSYREEGDIDWLQRFSSLRRKKRGI